MIIVRALDALWRARVSSGTPHPNLRSRLTTSFLRPPGSLFSIAGVQRAEWTIRPRMVSGQKLGYSLIRRAAMPAAAAVAMLVSQPGSNGSLGN